MMKSKINAGDDAFIVWMDLYNAFGSIKHNLMFAALKFYGIPDEMIELIASLYKECYVKVKTMKWTTRSIRIEKGSLQGGPEAGLCFNVTWNLGLDFLVHVAQAIGGTGVEKPVAGFADDVTLAATNRVAIRAIGQSGRKLL